MKPGEVLSNQHDNNRRGLPKEYLHRKSGNGISQASIWTAKRSEDFEPPQFWGAFPRSFIEWACRAMQCRRQDVVHMCSGTIPPGEGALRIDIRAETQPDVVADCRALPLPDNCAGAVMLDPPYSVEYAQDLYDTEYPQDLYDTEYPRPSHLLAEASRIAKPGAPIGILHFLVCTPPAGVRIESIHGVTTGPNYRIRAFTVFRKHQQDLGFSMPESQKDQSNG